MQIRVAALILTVAGVVAVWVLCLAHMTPGTGAYNDKLQHLSAYFLQGACMAILFPRHRRWVLLGFIAQGALIEGLQSLTPHRSAEWADMGANAFGLLLGMGFALSPAGRWISRQLQPETAS